MSATIEFMDEGTKDKREHTRRCGWVALSFVLFLVQGILPLQLIGGVSSLKTGMPFGNFGVSELAARMLTLVVIILSLMLSAGAIMFLTMAIAKFSGTRIAASMRRSAVTRN